MIRPGLLVIALLPLACGSPRVSWETDWSAPYGTFDTDLRGAFTAARAEMDAGRLELARTRLATLAQTSPDNLEIGVWLQDVELALLEAAESPDSDPAVALRQLYLQRVSESPSVAGFVLAARAESDAIAAGILLDRALELDPTCAWAHYGKAHSLLRRTELIDRWDQARASLSRALTLDPSHLHARRLEAWVLAQEGDARAAARAYEVWLSRSAGDPRARSEDRRAVKLDLCIAWILSGHPREAAELLIDLEGRPEHRPRRLAVLAVALHEMGEIDAALDAARRAENAEPGSLLPVVQQAILLQHNLEDQAAAEARWAAVTEASGGDLASMLQGLRARVELERAGASQ